jgi:hypothetical protein
MKYLYIVRYWVPFPSSEYGGVISVIAGNDEECHDILLEWRDDYNSQYDSNIMEEVKLAVRYELNPQVEYDTGIVDSFTT